MPLTPFPTRGHNTARIIYNIILIRIIRNIGGFLAYYQPCSPCAERASSCTHQRASGDVQQSLVHPPYDPPYAAQCAFLCASSATSGSTPDNVGE